MVGVGREIDVVDGYAIGSRRAIESGLPMLLVFRASWCRWSEAFLAEVPAEPRLVGLAGQFVCITIDADRDPATCRSFGVDAFPTVIVLDRERRETFRATGAAARSGLAVAVESVLREPPSRIAGQSSTPSR
jgi:thioredoxin-like negative regulator of GroEL